MGQKIERNRTKAESAGKIKDSMLNFRLQGIELLGVAAGMTQQAGVNTDGTKYANMT
jgi:hypothetical protein